MCVCVCVCVFLVVLWYPSADTEAQVEFGFKWILNSSAYLLISKREVSERIS